LKLFSWFWKQLRSNWPSTFHCSVRNFLTICHVLSITAFCVRVYRAVWKLSSSEILFKLSGLAVEPSRASVGRIWGHRSADAGASDGPTVRLHVFGLSWLCFPFLYLMSPVNVFISQSDWTVLNAVYWLLAVAGRCKVVLLWLICFKLPCWPAVNVSVTFTYALLLFLCCIYSVILICIWLFNTPFIIPGEVLVCFSVSWEYAHSLPARFTNTGPSDQCRWTVPADGDLKCEPTVLHVVLIPGLGAIPWAQPYHLFSFRGSVQDYKIHMDMEIVKFA
jgi:hypothetical protein